MKRTLGILLALGLIGALIVILRTQTSLRGGSEEAPIDPPRPALPPQPAKTVAASPASILGTVTDGDSPRGIEGAKVQLFLQAKPGAMKDRGISKVPARGYLWNETPTNLAGRFQIALPEPGTYYLRVEKEGFAPVELPAFSVGNEKAPPDQRIALRKAATLELRPTYRGDPLRGYQAVLLGKNLEPQIAPIEFGGKALFTGLPAGPYWIRIDPAGIDASLYHWESDAMQKGDPSISLADGETRILEFPLEGARPGKAAGEVKINDGPPEGTCRVVWTSLDGPEGLPILPFEVKTDANGRFQAERIFPGRYRVQIVQPPSSAPLWQQEVTIASGDWTNVNVSIRAGYCVGRALGAPDRPSRQARVVFKGEAGDVGPLQLAYWTDVEGRFRTDEVPAGEYEIAIYSGSGEPLRRKVRIDRGEVDLGEIRP